MSGATLIVARRAISRTTPDRFWQAKHNVKFRVAKTGGSLDFTVTGCLLKEYVDEQVGECGYCGSGRCRLHRIAARPCAYFAQMTAKPIIPTRLARQDVEDEVTRHLVDEGSEQAAPGFIAEIEQTYAHLAKHPDIGSPHYAYELAMPGLRSWSLEHYPHLIFYYFERKDHVEVWRVLNGKRDIPAWPLSDDSEFP